MDLKDKSPDDAAWARRLLATVLAAGGAHERAFELVGLADEGASYIPGADEPADELRARAAVLVFRNNPVARRAAIRILEFLGDRELAIAEDRHRLAQLYEAQGTGPRPTPRSATCWPAIPRTRATWHTRPALCSATN